MVQYRDRCVINNLAMGETTYTYKPVRSVTFHLSILSGEMEVTKGALLRRLPRHPFHGDPERKPERTRCEQLPLKVFNHCSLACHATN